MDVSVSNKQVYYRLVALWVVIEAFLGGIIHGLKLPVSGLVIGSGAVIIISLIAFYTPEKGAILKATVVVAIFKMMLSPHSPPAAYLAVFFQGLMGEFLFLNRRYYRVSCLLLGMIALFESGIQRIVIVTIIYGMNGWQALNEFIRSLSGEESVTNYSLYLAAGYVSVHLLAGIVAGWYAGIIPKNLNSWKSQLNKNGGLPSQRPDVSGKSISQTRTGKKRWQRKGLIGIWVLLLIIYAQSSLPAGKPILPPHLIVGIVVRSLLIVLTWYILISPVVLRLLKRWLEKQKSKSGLFISEITNLIPSMRQLVACSWKLSEGKDRWRRLQRFSKFLLVASLSGKKIYISAGNIQTGKTTRILSWAGGKKKIFGILTPVADGKRFFLDLKTRESFPMEAAGDEEFIGVGKYRFSHAGFQRAKKILRDALQEKSGWIVVDEIGPLELEGSGFSEEVKACLQNSNPSLEFIFVVRTMLVKKVTEYFSITNFAVISENDETPEASENTFTPERVGISSIHAGQ